MPVHSPRITGVVRMNRHPSSSTFTGLDSAVMPVRWLEISLTVTIVRAEARNVSEFTNSARSCGEPQSPKRLEVDR